MPGHVMPMFPLGTTLVPGMVLPLHVFEPRYRALVDDCLVGEPEFGVVLIERGSEVGGGDQRNAVGTVARIMEAGRFDDGRWALGCVGVRRIRVQAWLPDDPYPRAEVDDWPDAEPGPDAGRAARDVVTRLRSVLAQAAELGLPVAPATSDLAEDPLLASYQAAALAPIGALDTYALLSEPGPDERLTRLRQLLDEEASVLAQRLALAGEDLDPGEATDRPDDP